MLHNTNLFLSVFLSISLSLQVFVESLLCSGREENIRLAGQLVHCSAVSEDTPVSVAFRGKAHARVAYNRSAELVLDAAREYFNSSATLGDSCMNLARYDAQLSSWLFLWIVTL